MTHFLDHGQSLPPSQATPRPFCLTITSTNVSNCITGRGDRESMTQMMDSSYDVISLLPRERKSQPTPYRLYLGSSNSSTTLKTVVHS
jgi:hypothetical protein